MNDNDRETNVSQYEYCFGCGICATVCHSGAITMHLNDDGFYAPSVKEDKCVGCGLCLAVCAKEESPQFEKPLRSWAAWSKDERIRRKCSSGGVSFEIGKQLIENGYKAVGCRYDTRQQRAEHYIATTVEEFVQSIGSKYIQSYTEEAFKKIDRKQKYLITGTPCQIASFRRMTKKFHCEDSFILLDFYCHCVPSMNAWKAYVKMLEPKIGKITYASWRNKFDYGWHDSWLMAVDGTKTSEPVDWSEPFDKIVQERTTAIQSRMSKGDLFYKLFLGDVCLGPQCEKDCKYKYNCSSADIRIGDLWGPTYKNDEKGVSALVAFTDKGKTVVEGLNNISLVEHPFEIVAEGQMKSNARHKEMTPIIMKLLRRGCSLDSIPFRVAMLTQRVITKIKNTLRR